ncbi:hypothetical protein BC936DRAFT_136841 [Jimgerdemannia flammicorona]|uniref:Amino acid permease-domain-containing protein n=1 Tax=Jimgerdemannia flammicorona TaxID=994334 RepID=A0A433CYN6_9FUNG|nr:hypothetical protein BC936DRAFT_136841 [Jimgerdemannia flammicorona]
MCMFAIGNLFLKYKRGPLPRTVRVSSVTAIFGLTCLAAGLVGNFVIDPDIARHFFIYFAVIMTIMMVMLNRVWLLKTLFFYFDQITVLHRFPVVADSFIKAIRSLKKQPVVFFTKTDEIYHLNKAVLYVRANENAGGIKFVHIYEKIEDIPERLEANHRVLDEIYPKIQIDLVYIHPRHLQPVDRRHHLAHAQRAKISHVHMLSGVGFPAWDRRIWWHQDDHVVDAQSPHALEEANVFCSGPGLIPFDESEEEVSSPTNTHVIRWE